MIIFNSSMPRSGSTLMQNILGQNPDMHVTPTDGFLELIYAARVNFTNNAEFKAQDQEQMLKAWRGFCLEGMKGYCAGLSGKSHTCIKSRGIGEQFDWFKSFMGEDPKIIVMVRNLKSILASMEKMYRANTEKAQQVHSPTEMRGLTTEARVNQWLSGPPVGLALQRLQQMSLQGTLDKCLVVKFEDLTSNPEHTMGRVYKYLGIDPFVHDFENVKQLTQEDDAVYGMTPDLHIVRPKVESIKPDYKDVLGVNLCKAIDNMCAGYQEDYSYV